MNNDYDFFFWLAVVANWCQIESYEMNKKQISNDEIMKHLEKQDDILNEQTNDYLKKTIVQNEIIIRQNEDIISLLKGGE